MVGVAQLAEHWVVAPVGAGSNPVTHPRYFTLPEEPRHMLYPHPGEGIGYSPQDIFLYHIGPVF